MTSAWDFVTGRHIAWESRLADKTHREKMSMHAFVRSVRGARAGQMRLVLAHGVAYPLFLAAEMLRRIVASVSTERAPASYADRSIFAAAHESTLLAISHALMARRTLQTFARQNRTERLS